ncbi:MAG: hypothetical protein QE269_11040 [Fimbriimonas sp.]|nr:hypothetical protein [Fimbriimonas sp.]
MEKATFQEPKEKPTLVLSYIGIWLGSFLGLAIGSIQQHSAWWFVFGLLLLIVATISVVVTGSTTTHKRSLGIALALFAGTGFTTCGALQLPEFLEGVQAPQNPETSPQSK